MPPRPMTLSMRNPASSVPIRDSGSVLIGDIFYQPGRLHPVPPPRAWRISGLRLVEELLPALEQRLQLVALAPVGCDDVDVRPVLGESALELGDSLLACRDLGF